MLTKDRCHKTAIQDTFIIDWDLYKDDRGYVGNIWKYSLINQPRFIEDRISISKKHVFRGLHGDARTWKFMTIMSGEAWLVLVDARRKSPTYKELVYINCNSSRRESVLVPPGVLNGHLCLSEECVLFYKWSDSYTGPDNQVTVRWDDPDLSISLGCPDPILSDRDKVGLPFKDVVL